MKFTKKSLIAKFIFFKKVHKNDFKTKNFYQKKKNLIEKFSFKKKI